MTHLESPNTSRKHFFFFFLTNAEGRHVHSFTLNCKVKERESPESGAFYFQSDRDSVSFRDRRERIIHFLRHCEIESEVWQSGRPFERLNVCIKGTIGVHSG